MISNKATAFFHYRNADPRSTQPGAIFDGISRPDAKAQSRGVMLARGAGLKTLRFVATDPSGMEGCYDLDGDLKLKRVDDPKGLTWTKEHAAIPHDVISEDAASIVYTDEKQRRWRLPRAGGTAGGRVCREVCTERNLLNLAGTFYELPAQNAGGFVKVRPIATHNLRIHDYASYRGLMLISGVDADAPAGEHIIRSDDGRVALWAGAVDDLWKLGKPRGTGGPWKNSAIKAGVPSDPYLATGFDRKRLTVSHQNGGLVRIPRGGRLHRDRHLGARVRTVTQGETQRVPRTQLQRRLLRLLGPARRRPGHDRDRDLHLRVSQLVREPAHPAGPQHRDPGIKHDPRHFPA